MEHRLRFIIQKEVVTKRQPLSTKIHNLAHRLFLINDTLLC